MAMNANMTSDVNESPKVKQQITCYTNNPRIKSHMSKRLNESFPCKLTRTWLWLPQNLKSAKKFSTFSKHYILLHV